MAWLMFCLAAGGPSAAQDQVPPEPLRGDVRPLQPRGVHVLEEGIRRSPSIAALVSQIRWNSNVIVYVDLEPNEPGPSSIDGTLRFRGAAAGLRYLRVWLQPRHSDVDLMALLGHELQHAVEVARAPWVTSANDLETLFATLDARKRRGDSYDTREARLMTGRVQRELVLHR